MSRTVWFSYEDEEAELHDVYPDTSVSTLRRRLHAGKIFRFPEAVAQTDIQIGRVIGDKFEKLKARNAVEEFNLKTDETLHVRIKKPKAQSNIGISVPSASLLIFQGAERAVKWYYDPNTTTAEWMQTAVLVRVEQVPFAEGTFRQAFHCVDLGQLPAQNKYVAKISKKACSRESYFEDVKMQMIARKWADKYNELNPPKQIGFLASYVMELVDRQPETVVCGVEAYVEGVYRKYNNNSGYVSTEERNTPQSFSHFTYEHSNHQLLIVDIQGVGDHYTDPQIHTYDGNGFGQGNLGKKGFEKFLDTHKCNAICQYLELNPINPKSERKDGGTIPRPELNLRSMESAATTSSVSVLEFLPNSASSKRKSWGEREREIQMKKEEEAEKLKQAARDWDLNSIKCVDTLKAHTDAVGALCVVENTLYSGCADGNIKVWDIKTLECTATIKAHEGSVECLVANDQMFFSASADNSIKVWDQKRNRSIYTLDGHDKPVHILCINEKYLFSGSADKTIKVWDLRSLDCKFTLEGHNRAVKALCVSGQYLFSGSNDQTIKVWDLKNFRCNYTLRGHGKWIKGLGIWGTDLYSGSYDKTIKVWSLKTLECTNTLRGHERWVENTCISEGVMFSASDDNTIKVWVLEEPVKCVTTLEGHNGTVQSLAVSAQKRLLFSGSHDTTIKVWSWERFPEE